jgi:thymidylate kinase
MFFVLDGPNGVGKTSLINKLSKNGYKTLSSPYGTQLAKILRPMCRGEGQWRDIDPKIQFLLFSAARYDEYVRLVHDKKEIIFADRWWTSTYAYQCIYQGIEVNFMEKTIHPYEKIDKVFILDAKNETILNRVNKEREENKSHGRCSWTSNEQSMIDIADIYRNDLPKYLNSKSINNEILSTEDLTLDGVYENVIDKVKELL